MPCCVIVSLIFFFFLAHFDEVKWDFANHCIRVTVKKFFVAQYLTDATATKFVPVIHLGLLRWTYTSDAASDLHFPLECLG